jgi:hypothetical protein
MAKHQVTHSCGHVETVNLIGKHSDRDRKMAWMETKPCLECLQAETEKRRQAEASAAAAKAQQDGLPALIGTDKQVRWAETIRAALIPALINLGENFIRRNAELAELDRVEGPMPAGECKFHGRTIKTTGGLRAVADGEGRTAGVLAKMGRETNASWWIDHREGFSLASFAAMVRDFQPPSQAEINGKAKLATPEVKALEIEALAEATLMPVKMATKIPCEIRINGSDVELLFPEKREDFRQLVKFTHYFAWDDAKWSRRGTADKAVEMGVAILALGIPVRINDRTIRERVAAGDQIRENTKKITKATAGIRSGWFVIGWKKSDGDYYAKAKRIPGSKWENGKMVAPADAADTIADFAKVEGFELSPGAIGLIENVRAIRAAATKVSVSAPAQPEPAERLPSPTKLEVPENVEVADEFRD